MRIAILTVTAALTLAMAVAGGGEAAVVGAGPAGFQVQMQTRIAAPPDKVWAAIVKPGDWWNPEHTYSSDARNMTIAAVAGGCWCEKWPGGSVAHMTVVYVVPGKTIRMRGGLGPLQEMGVDGALTWTISGAIDGGTTVTLDYQVGGYSARGFDGISRAVDGVLTEQVRRLALFLETGHPIARATQ